MRDSPFVFLGFVPNHPSLDPKWWRPGYEVSPDGEVGRFVGVKTVPVAPPTTRTTAKRGQQDRRKRGAA